MATRGRGRGGDKLVVDPLGLLALAGPGEDLGPPGVERATARVGGQRAAGVGMEPSPAPALIGLEDF